MPGKSVLLAVLVTSLLGCNMTASEPPQAAAESDPCEAIGKLLESYRDQFADIRGTRRSFNRIDIWSTRFQLVGNGCEIWGWQGGKYNYTCNYVAPDEETARAIYQEAAAKLNHCAKQPWQREETTTQQGIGLQSVWRRADFSGVVDLKLVQTRGIGKPRWAIYLLIGDYNTNI